MISTIGKLLLVSGALATAGLTSLPAAAEARVTIPFNFSVGGEQYPAGQYLLKQGQIYNRVLTIQSKDTPTAFNCTLTPGGDNDDPSKVAVIFDVRDGSYALRNVQYGTLTSPRFDRAIDRSEHTPVRVIEGQ